MNFLVFWNGNGTVDPFLMSISGEEKEKIVLLFFQENERGKILLKLVGNGANNCWYSLMEMLQIFSSGELCSNQTWRLNSSMQESPILLMATRVTFLTCCTCSRPSWQGWSSGAISFLPVCKVGVVDCVVVVSDTRIDDSIVERCCSHWCLNSPCAENLVGVLRWRTILEEEASLFELNAAEVKNVEITGPLH